MAPIKVKNKNLFFNFSTLNDNYKILKKYFKYQAVENSQKINFEQGLPLLKIARTTSDVAHFLLSFFIEMNYERKGNERNKSSQ